MMAARIIDGKAFAADVRGSVAQHVMKLKKEHDLTPGLAVVLVGEDAASEVYVRNKAKQTLEVGMNSYEHKLPADTTEETLLALIDRLNTDPAVHGILVQLPLPRHLDANLVITAIHPAKDVDGFHISNVGLLASGQKALVPCTPFGCLMLLRNEIGDLRGKTATVIGRSNIVGKPMAQLLLGADCSVTVVHRWSSNIAELVRASDIVVAAVGQPGLIQADWVKPGAVVIDVGINRVPAPDKGEYATKLVGDVQFDEVQKIAGAITPVPGGVGPMTIACLLANTVTACCRANGLPEPTGLTV
ncbi:bifunctional methylenetetrahydrofolate dehydrogenase/methenyltetrahydrofolate cyclohydrolase FolD [Pseudomonas cedrina]|nr:bifunctional methylenetetrahydrofolate dehydrogenase/methenyltetrahydrofolate cyclohydrolase FolD [Pseudomonas cedrina]